MRSLTSLYQLVVLAKISEEMWQFLKERIQCFDISIPSLNSNTYKLMRGKDLVEQALINTKKLWNMV